MVHILCNQGSKSSKLKTPLRYHDLIYDTACVNNCIKKYFVYCLDATRIYQRCDEMPSSAHKTKQRTRREKILTGFFS